MNIPGPEETLGELFHHKYKLSNLRSGIVSYYEEIGQDSLAQEAVKLSYVQLINPSLIENPILQQIVIERAKLLKIFQVGTDSSSTPEEAVQ